jgi:hypothetical protein
MTISACVDNDTFSNSIHICNADDVFDCFRNLPKDCSLKPSVSLEALSKSNAFTYPLKNSFEQSSESTAKLPIVTWRTLVISGRPPCGRYLHSSSYLHGNDIIENVIYADLIKSFSFKNRFYRRELHGDIRRSRRGTPTSVRPAPAEPGLIGVD